MAWALVLLCLVLLGSLPCSLQRFTIGERDLNHLSHEQLVAITSHPDPKHAINLDDPTSHLSKILIPRPVGSDNNTLVKDHIVSTMKALKWHVEEDAFEDDTPYGRKRFVNVIATKDPQATRRVIVAAHFDSKFFPTYPQNQFVGATDSAAPVAFMLDLAAALDPLLDARHARFEDGEETDDDVADTTLQLVFFDGEEAFKDWTARDSIYGARHLAARWAGTYVLPERRRRLLAPQMTELDGVEHLILLDLLGAPQPLIQSAFADTHWLFDALAGAEARLRDAGLLLGPGGQKSVKPFVSWFLARTANQYVGHIEDDHVPFVKRGVSTLHVISNPFPRVWHTLKDDVSALDLDTMQRWVIILRVFMAEYLNLRPEDAKVARSETHTELVRTHRSSTSPSY